LRSRAGAYIHRAKNQHFSQILLEFFVYFWKSVPIRRLRVGRGEEAIDVCARAHVRIYTQG
jgi:hypothetical protein